MRREADCLLAFALACLMSGCTHLTSEVGGQLPLKPASLIVGESHLSDVLAAAGPPSQVSAAAGGYALLYEYNAVEEKQLGFNINVPVLQFIKFVGAKSWLEHQTWLVTFDTNNIVRGMGEEYWRTVLGHGAGAQILVTVSSLVDSSQVRRPASQHDWGKSSLVALPKALNSGESLDNGSFGVEQRLAPTSVGQRALEMTPTPRKFPKKK